MKTAGPVPDRQGLHQALLAYLSDSFLIDVCLIASGTLLPPARLRSAVRWALPA
jgi:acyl-CoA thioesterase